jgi:hypothetical protein
MTTFHLPLRFRFEYPRSMFVSETSLLSINNIEQLDSCRPMQW